MMRAFAIALLAGLGALSIGSAKATDLTTSNANTDLLQQARWVCRGDGRCFHTRGPYAYDYGPRYRYGYSHRYYRDWDEPRPGIGIYGPGFGIGVGPGY